MGVQLPAPCFLHSVLCACATHVHQHSGHSLSDALIRGILAHLKTLLTFARVNSIAFVTMWKLLFWLRVCLELSSLIELHKTTCSPFPKLCACCVVVNSCHVVSLELLQWMKSVAF